VLADDFIAGGVVGNAMFGSRELYGSQFPRTVVQRETLDRIWHDRGRVDIVKLDIEGHEIKFLEGSRDTISAHRPVLLIKLNRVHHEIRGTDFDSAILSLLPAHYILAELRAGGITRISHLAECNDTDFLAVPEERRHELSQHQS
jgi:methyltransferase FkbM-like protein